ncbi:unnamed protein product [Clonostachys rosea]|uniref:ATPase expression protein 2, mitochondrial n=1 Tax=Bionectria ochroleuca TaxID=29856 RepID=A0ABY6UR81_BIOOC|nr:unnamed protein product [Clonostachys rosea]
MAKPVTYRPSWHFEVINNPTDWQWEPPTTPETRHKDSAKISLKNLSGKLLRWLEDSDLDKPFIDPPPEVLDIPAAIDSPTAEQSMAVPSAAPVTIITDLHQLRSAICGMDKVIKTSLRPNLVRRIRSGDITVEDLIESMNPLDTATVAHISNYDLTRTVISKVRSAIVTTLSELRAQDLKDDYREAWVAVMNHSLTARANSAGFRTLALLIEKAQPMDRTLIPIDGLATRLYDLIQSMVVLSKKKVTLEDAAQLAQVMRLLEPSMREDVSHKVESIVAEAFAAGLSYEYRYWWMVFKAHYTDVSFSEFEEAVNAYLESNKRPNDHQSLLLISARMFADNCVDAESYMTFARQLRGDYQEKHWLTLAKKVMDSRGRQGLTSLWCHLGALKYDVRFFEKLVVFSQKRRTRDDSVRLMKDIVSNPLLPSLRFWLALNGEMKRIMSPHPTSSEAGVKPDEMVANKKHLMELVDMMARWYETAPDLTNRMAFRGLSRCIRFQTQLSGRPSAQVLRSMTTIVTSKLRDGQVAPAGRLHHYVENIVAPNQGVEVARSCRNILASWQKQASLEATIKEKRRHVKQI